MKAPVTTPKPFIFVLMPFDEKFKDIYKFGIKGAAEKVGAFAERLDEQIFVEGMLDHIFNQISRADVIVADMTGRNPNVFYEVGYAHALGKITLLLTQNTDDIPFDLKHRQHTVYGGSIDALKKELVKRLKWAISESKRQAIGSQCERLSLQILNLEIPRTSESTEVPVVSGTTGSSVFRIPLLVRNDSVGSLPSITHVYLFAEENAGAIPCRDGYSKMLSPGLVAQPQGYQHLLSFPSSVPINWLQASSMDAHDGLVHQFRLAMDIPPLPNGAVEEESINFMFQKGAEIANSMYRLRFHTPSQYHDFAFRLKIEFQPPEK